MSRAGAAAAVFDVDGTICDTHSTMSRSLMWLRQRQHTPWRHGLWLSSLAWRVPLLWVTDQYNRDASDRQVYRQFAGLSAWQIAADASRCCDDVLLPICFREARDEIAMHLAAGRRAVLVSGGIDVLLAPLAAALGAELLAQRLVASDGRLTGEYRTYEVLGDVPPGMSQAARKAAALAKYAETSGIDLSASFAYGDSVNDLEMLAMAGTPVAVRPDRHLARIAQTRGWAVRQWRNGGR